MKFRTPKVRGKKWLATFSPVINYLSDGYNEYFYIFHIAKWVNIDEFTQKYYGVGKSFQFSQHLKCNSKRAFFRRLKKYPDGEKAQLWGRFSYSDEVASITGVGSKIL